MNTYVIYLYASSKKPGVVFCSTYCAMAETPEEAVKMVRKNPMVNRAAIESCIVERRFDEPVAIFTNSTTLALSSIPKSNVEW